MFLPHPRVKVSIAVSLRDREVACSASDRQGSSFESCVGRTVSSQSSHHPQEVLLAQFSIYVHKGGLKPDSFHFSGEQSFLGTKLVFDGYKINPCSAKLSNLFFSPTGSDYLYRFPQLQVVENDSYLFNLRPTFYKSWCLNTHFFPKSVIWSTNKIG